MRLCDINFNRCAVPLCTQAAPSGGKFPHLFCLNHWLQLPTHSRRKFNRLYQADTEPTVQLLYYLIILSLTRDLARARAEVDRLQLIEQSTREVQMLHAEGFNMNCITGMALEIQRLRSTEQ